MFPLFVLTTCIGLRNEASDNSLPITLTDQPSRSRYVVMGFGYVEGIVQSKRPRSLGVCTHAVVMLPSIAERIGERWRAEDLRDLARDTGAAHAQRLGAHVRAGEHFARVRLWVQRGERRRCFR